MRNITSRRTFFGRSLAFLSGLAAAPSAFSLPNSVSRAPASRCVLLWMNGGPSQLETFDPKPGASTGGPTTAIKTKVPGIQIAEHLPRVAERMDRLAVLRNVTSGEGEHERAQYFLHTGFQMVPAFPRPSLGSVVSHELPESDIPKYVLLGNDSYGPAYCGPDNASFAIENADAARDLLGRIRRRKNDLEFARTLNADFDTNNNFPQVARRSSMLSRIETLVTTSFRNALNVDAESATTRQRYGDHEFGQRCLLARRLLERDVPFVEVQLDGWDTHVNNFEQVAELATSLDGPWSALMDDLVTNGLWDDTLIVWMGDFGRTPTINGQNGRDHFPAVTPVVFGGGCIRAGQSIGSTNRGGNEIEGQANAVADVAATILHLLGTPPDTEFITSFGSPTTVTNDGNVITELLNG
jgi:Protein of unknown function (DUF1501)